MNIIHFCYYNRLGLFSQRRPLYVFVCTYSSLLLQVTFSRIQEKHQCWVSECNCPTLRKAKVKVVGLSSPHPQYSAGLYITCHWACSHQYLSQLPREYTAQLPFGTMERVILQCNFCPHCTICLLIWYEAWEGTWSPSWDSNCRPLSHCIAQAYALPTELTVPAKVCQKPSQDMTMVTNDNPIFADYSLCRQQFPA